jgi:hypothetical protein
MRCRNNVACMYVYTCMHTCMHTYMYTYSRGCAVACQEGHRIKGYIHAYIHTYIHAYVHTYMHTYIYTYIQQVDQQQLVECKKERQRMKGHIHTCIHTYIHAYIHTHIHQVDPQQLVEWEEERQRIKERIGPNVLKAAAQALIEREKKQQAQSLTGATPLPIDGGDGATPSLIDGGDGATPSLIDGGDGATPSLIDGGDGATPLLIDGDNGAEQGPSHDGGIAEEKTHARSDCADALPENGANFSLTVSIESTAGGQIVPRTDEKHDTSMVALAETAAGTTSAAGLVNATQGWLGSVGTLDGDTAGQVCYFGDWHGGKGNEPETALNAQVLEGVVKAARRAARLAAKRGKLKTKALDVIEPAAKT